MKLLRRPIAELFDPQPDVIVGDGHQAEAAADPDTGGWVDLSATDPLIASGVPTYTPRWFAVIGEADGAAP